MLLKFHQIVRIDYSEMHIMNTRAEAIAAIHMCMHFYNVWSKEGYHRLPTIYAISFTLIVHDFATFSIM